MRYLTVVPAYGRDYKSQKAIQDDWDAGKDFMIRDLFESGYINKDDTPDSVQINVRYASDTKVYPIKHKRGKSNG